MRVRGREHRARFVDRERVVVAEGIAEARELERGNLGDEILRDPAHILRAAIRELRWDGVRRKQRGHNAHRPLGVDPRHRAQHAQLCAALKSIARFGLRGVRARAQHPVAMLARSGEQFVLRSRACGFHRTQDSAPGGGNLLISSAGNALLELRGAVAGKDHVRVRIHKARRNATALCILNHCMGRNFGLEFAIRSGSGDAPVLNQQRRIASDAQFAELRTNARARQPRQRNELADIDDCA
jgi:hypothetical protein